MRRWFSDAVTKIVSGGSDANSSFAASSISHSTHDDKTWYQAGPNMSKLKAMLEITSQSKEAYLRAMEYLYTCVLHAQQRLPSLPSAAIARPPSVDNEVYHALYLSMPMQPNGDVIRYQEYVFSQIEASVLSFFNVTCTFLNQAFEVNHSYFLADALRVNTADRFSRLSLYFSVSVLCSLFSSEWVVDGSLAWTTPLPWITFSRKSCM